MPTRPPSFPAQRRIWACRRPLRLRLRLRLEKGAVGLSAVATCPQAVLQRRRALPAVAPACLQNRPSCGAAAAFIPHATDDQPPTYSAPISMLSPDFVTIDALSMLYRCIAISGQNKKHQITYLVQTAGGK